MPQDDVEEVREALLGARHANENPVFYRMHTFCIFSFILLYLSFSNQIVYEVCNTNQILKKEVMIRFQKCSLQLLYILTLSLMSFYCFLA